MLTGDRLNGLSEVVKGPRVGVKFGAAAGDRSLKLWFRSSTMESTDEVLLKLPAPTRGCSVCELLMETSCSPVACMHRPIQDWLVETMGFSRGRWTRCRKGRMSRCTSARACCPQPSLDFVERDDVVLAPLLLETIVADAETIGPRFQSLAVVSRAGTRAGSRVLFDRGTVTTTGFIGGLVEDENAEAEV